MRIDQIVFEWIPPNSPLAHADGSGYWGFSIYCGESLEGCGSADDLGAASPALLELLKHKVNTRRPFWDDDTDGYLESDKDYVGNNLELCVRLLDAIAEEEKKL